MNEVSVRREKRSFVFEIHEFQIGNLFQQLLFGYGQRHARGSKDLSEVLLLNFFEFLFEFVE